MIKIADKLINLKHVSWLNIEKQTLVDGSNEWVLWIYFNSGYPLKFPFATEIAAEHEFQTIHAKMVNL